MVETSAANMSLPQRSASTRASVLTDGMEKPQLDNRTYRVVRLANDLEALLIHDPDTDKASAAMDVNIGSFSDADDMPGMAHAVEHLLFMGTEKVRDSDTVVARRSDVN
jgi:insulysin